MTIKLPEPRKITGTEVGYYYTKADLTRAVEDALATGVKGLEQLNVAHKVLIHLKPLMEWRPIETAPRDGSKIIVFYLNRNGSHRTVMSSWLSEDQADEIDDDGVGLDSGWYEQIDNWDDYNQVAIYEGDPTHWMPLPQPPKE